ncbi:hypothetical protein BDP27DRAFT_1451386 [Rhodocollybia butyracea]|uniref:C2H2-type domain-containing protein n=1 Tax=Rhodocollybia butyracea TaxID=206335 RepID=A0A9P5PDH2_9AGAR|nr:hypothetical protein BDP27DRAFT_1451386 [Rhodocollybia butyracea]
MNFQNGHTYPQKALDEESSGHISDDTYSCGTTNYRPFHVEGWPAFGGMIPSHFYFDPSICVTSQVESIEYTGDSSTSPENVNEMTRRMFTSSNQRYPTPPNSTSSMSPTASHANSPVFEYSGHNDHDLSSSRTLAQGPNLPPPFMERSWQLRDTENNTHSSNFPHHNPSWQSPYPTSEVSQLPLLDGGASSWEPPGVPSNASIISQVRGPIFSRDSFLPQPLLSVNEGDGKPIVGHRVHSTQKDSLRRRSNTKGRFKCPMPHCGKSYTAKHNLQGHIDVKHLGKVTPHICEYCGSSFTGTRAHRRHMHNKNVCPTSPFARDVAS